MRSRIFLFVLFTFLLVVPSTTQAALRAFIKEYTYQASELDSKVTCRTSALEQVKRLLLEELGTYLESHTEVINFQISKDKITSLTAGIVETKILDESWNGVIYWMKAEIKADPDEVADSLKKLRSDWDEADELEDARKQLESVMAENEKLKQGLQSAAQKKPSVETAQQYNRNINKIKALNLFSKAQAMYRGRNFDQAFQLVRAAIDLDPKNPKSYGLLIRIYQAQGQRELALRAVKDVLSKELNPADPETFILRGYAYQVQKKDRQAVKEYSLGIQLKPDSAKFHRLRSFSLARLRQSRKALADADKSIELKPDDYRNHMIRGVVYARARKPRQAISDMDKAIQMNPQAAKAYFFRGMVYKRQRDRARAAQDFSKACQLGFRKACKEQS